MAVAAVPEGLPLVATVAQMAAARRLSRRGVLVRTRGPWRRSAGSTPCASTRPAPSPRTAFAWYGPPPPTAPSSPRTTNGPSPSYGWPRARARRRRPPRAARSRTPPTRPCWTPRRPTRTGPR
ncbi:hypothetical protein ACFQV4_28280 [Streptomyces thermocarboxydus]